MLTEHYTIMKIITFLGAAIIGLAVACSSSTEQSSTTKDTAELKDGTNVESAGTAEPDSSLLIIPGKQAGKIYLGQDMQEVFKLLGNASDGDAAMGSAIAIWYAKGDSTAKKDPVVIFSSYRDSNMVVKSVKQVSVAAPAFRTTAGIHMGAKLSEVLAAYPKLRQSETYVNRQDSLKVYDSIKEGIAFDIKNDSCTAITIHLPGRPANALYLSVHPGWKKLQ